MNNIPKTDLKICPVTLGTMTYGSPVGFKDAVELTKYAIGEGINLIDTANMYEGYNRYAGSSGGVAEEIVGEALKSFVRPDVLVATKVGMKVGTAPEDEGTSPAAIQKQLDKSLKRLGTDYIDLYYLHRPDPSVPLFDIISALKKQIDAGKIRYYGISNYTAEQVRELLDAADVNSLPRPVACQPPLSLLKRDALTDLIPLCAKEGIGVIPYQIYQGGLLTGKYKRGMTPPDGSRAEEKPDWIWNMDETLFDKLEEYESEASSRGFTLNRYALRWVLEQTGVISAIVGVKNIRQIDAALEAVR